MSTFTLPYAEYDIANLLQNTFKKKDGFSVSIPLSRQQKGFDLLLVNERNKKLVTIQVKSSRVYLGGEEEFEFYSWFNAFDIKDNVSDFYFLYTPYQFPNTTKGWKRKIVVFNAKEMKDILENVKTKKGTPEKFFSLGFNDKGGEIGGGRGFALFKKKDYSENLFEKMVGEVREGLK